MSYTIGLDFETYAGISLPDVGLDNYVSHSTFTPLQASTYRRGPNGEDVRRRFDFVNDYFVAAQQGLRDELGELTIVAHNAPFEMAVCDWLKFDLQPEDFRCSAVIARAVGAAGKLEAAAPQLLSMDKVEAGKGLMRLFSMPGTYQEANGSLDFDPLVVRHNLEKWEEYFHYCDIDAELGWEIHSRWGGMVTDTEWANFFITHDMNMVGWPVDTELVEEMQRRYLVNQEQALLNFRTTYEPGVEEDKQLNFNSFPQLKKWCEARGVRAKSFDEEHVTMYLAKIRARMEKHRDTMPTDQWVNLLEVEALLETKQILGGSSLKKLQAILNQTSSDNRLRGQYLHIGAGQSYRTSGRGVQMQNLKRLGEVANVDSLIEGDDDGNVVDWGNEELARNLRQVFTASHGDGQLIVGDFSSVESRGLAYLAGAEWKLQAFRDGLDMYKVLAAKIDACAYDAVTKPRRQFGKVGELSCGYQAGADAVQSFAKKMGTILTEGEAGQLVSDWRATNPEVVDLWALLDSMLHEAVEQKATNVLRNVGNGMQVRVLHAVTPSNLLKLHPGAQSICVMLVNPTGFTLLRRYFHGCYVRGRNICFYKPTEKKSGDVWVNHYRDPKTNEIRFYSIYGGKLAGILTQSMCREMFFRSLRKLGSRLRRDRCTNVQIIGQFHDEIVLDWWPTMAPSGYALDYAMKVLEVCMSDPGSLVGFPLEADVKHDYRYTK